MTALTLLNEVLAIVPTVLPDPDPIAPPGFEGPAAAIIGIMKWGGLILGVLAVIYVGALLLFNQQRGEAGRELGRLGWIAVGILVISAPTSIIGFVLDAQG